MLTIFVTLAQDELDRITAQRTTHESYTDVIRRAINIAFPPKVNNDDKNKTLHDPSTWCDFCMEYKDVYIEQSYGGKKFIVCSECLQAWLNVVKVREAEILHKDLTNA